MRKTLFTLHLYLALATAAFVILLGLTGSIMAFEPEIDRLIHRKISYVQPGAKAMSLEEVSAVVRKAFPGEQIEEYLPSVSPNLSYQIVLENSGAVYVNQYTGQILGVRPARIEFLNYVHQIHLRLAWESESQSDPGKKIMSWAGVAMLLLLLSGVYLWWPAKRAWISKGASGRRWWFDLHNTVGIVCFVFLLVLTITGIVIGFERQSVPLLYKLTGSQPAQMPRSFPPPPPGGQPISVDRVMEIARQALPGATPFMIMDLGPKRPLLVASRYPEDRTPGGRCRVLVDQYTGKVLYVLGSRTAPAGERVRNLNRAIHTGDVFGIPSKIVMSIASLMLVLQAASGVVMWWKRIRMKRRPLPLAKAAS